MERLFEVSTRPNTLARSVEGRWLLLGVDVFDVHLYVFVR